MSRYFNSYDTLIFDIPGVLFTSKGAQTTNVDAHMFRQIIGTQSWYNLEMAKISDNEAYALIAKQFSLCEDDIRDAVQKAIDSLVHRSEMFDLIADLKPGRKIYAMANMPSSIWEVVKRKSGALWDMFDGIFISGTVGGRKPDFAFYQHVLHETGAIPEHTLLVDDSRDNIVTGRCLGFKCILYDTFANVHQALHNLCGDPISRASEFLVSNAKRHHSFASASQIIHENVCQLLILEATNDPSLVDYPHYPAECNFFTGRSEFTTTEFPDDLDTTSIYWTVIPDVASHETKMKVMDRMLTCCNVDGIPLTYFDHNRQRRDHVICTNVLSLFYAHDRGEELSKATSFIHSILRTGAYSGGATYYEGSEVFF
ncbi:hypothetical protein CVT25_000708 [Psilocybe cyanescens]|uniref:Uncharacterized protein n=1 Tax=Psilocybe cyanescens TaxID=93625 RepID=A0A409XMF1_PSICY|nr:hypothetical protein CVT25_000708 [Psilocybe cyanescens]